MCPLDDILDVPKWLAMNHIAITDIDYGAYLPVLYRGRLLRQAAIGICNGASSAGACHRPIHHELYMLAAMQMLWWPTKFPHSSSYSNALVRDNP
jgi:hypothetical protein